MSNLGPFRSNSVAKMNNDREFTGVCGHPKASELTAAQLS